MNRTAFESEMLRSRVMAEGQTTEGPEFWRGRQRGLRRGFHGATFGTLAEHRRWLALSDDTDPRRAAAGKGYRDGLAAMRKGGKGA